MLAMDNNIPSQGSLHHFGSSFTTPTSCSYRNKLTHGFKNISHSKRSVCTGGENLWQEKCYNTSHLGVIEHHPSLSYQNSPINHHIIRTPTEPAPSLTTDIHNAYNQQSKTVYSPNLTGGTNPTPANVFPWHTTFYDQSHHQQQRLTTDHPPVISTNAQENNIVTQHQPTYPVNSGLDLLLRNQNHANYLLSFNDSTTNWCQQPSITKDVFNHPPTTKNTCSVCGKNYARPSTLKTHMRIHSGERPFLCDVCNKSFSQAANLTAHQRVHSGEKPFSCTICHKTFSQSSSVTTHMRTHSGDRPYKCPMCRKGFSDSSTLTKHLRIHSGEKPYQCNYCSMSFSQSGNLNRHMKVHEPNRNNLMNSVSVKTPSTQ